MLACGLARIFDTNTWSRLVLRVQPTHLRLRAALIESRRRTSARRFRDKRIYVLKSVMHTFRSSRPGLSPQSAVDPNSLLRAPVLVAAQ